MQGLLQIDLKGRDVMKLTLLAVVLVSLVFVTAVQAQWGHGNNGNRGWNPQPRHDYGHDRGRPTITVWWNSGGCPPPVQTYCPPPAPSPTFAWVNNVWSILVQTPFGQQWQPACNYGYPTPVQTYCAPAPQWTTPMNTGWGIPCAR